MQSCEIVVKCEHLNQPAKELTVYIKPINRGVLTMKRYQVILTGIVLLVAFGLLGGMDKEEEERQQAEYCEMVKLWKATNGQSGWPAFNGEGACK